MKKVYIPKLHKGISCIPLIFLKLDVQYRKDFFEEDNKSSVTPNLFFDVVDNVKDSELIILPHEYMLIYRKDKGYLNDILSLSKKEKIPLIIYVSSDFDGDIDLPNAIILRISKKTKKLKINEFIVPPISNELVSINNLNFLSKKNELPIVGFCGWADFNKYSLFYKAVIKDFVLGVRNFFTKGYFYDSNRNGVFLRKKILKILLNSQRIKANFIIRTAYGRHKNTINVDPKQSRREFVNNIKESDFSLAARGYSNHSLRFYEILSAGRIPVFIDTDSPLPLEDVIDYKKIMIRVDYRDIGRLDRIILDFYKNISNDDFIIMQKKAREIYKNYLQTEVFYSYFFDNIDKYVKKQPF